MQIDTEHLHYWIQAIRTSSDPMRTMDAFWRGQVRSKEWLIENLMPLIQSPVSVDIFGGWVGTLASMLFQSSTSIKQIRSIDIDPSCENIACTMNQIELEAGRFRAITADMCSTTSDADIIINTSCEHITQEQFDEWLLRMPQDSLLVLQSNDYKIPEHIRTSQNIDDFKNQSNLKSILYAGELELPLYKRFMIIGKKK
jgi:hypothetical protein